MVKVRITAKLVLTSATDALLTLYDLLQLNGYEVKLSPEALCLEASRNDVRVLFFASKSSYNASLTLVLSNTELNRGCGPVSEFMKSLIAKVRPSQLKLLTYVVSYESVIPCTKNLLVMIDRYLRELGAAPVSSPQTYLGHGGIKYEVISLRYGIVSKGLRSTDILVTYTVTASRCELKISVGGVTRDLLGISKYLCDAIGITEVIIDYLKTLLK